GSARSLALLQILRRDRGVEATLERGLEGLLARGLDGLPVLGLDGRLMLSLWPSRPKMPGSRCPNGRIALNMCVTIVAPAVTADWASSRVPSECPMEKIMPLDVMVGMREVILPSSGAAVIMVMFGKFSAP